MHKNQSFEEKVEAITKLFNECRDQDEKYMKLMDLGRKLPGMTEEQKCPDNIVKGCQSTMYLDACLDEEGKVVFQASSDALISSGLAAVLISVYSGEKPEVILMKEPEYLKELGISASLSPNRANGLYSIHLRMKQDALRLLSGK